MIFRTEKEAGKFMVLHKHFVDDPNLSFKAKGIMTYLLSKPDDWIFHQTDISNHAVDGETSVASGIKELIEKGYVIREQSRDDGKFGSNNFVVFETPQGDFTVTGFSGHGFHADGKAADGFHADGKPRTTNNNTTNNKITNNDYTNTKPADADFDALFSEWWNLYAKKIDAKKCKAKFERLLKDGADFDDIMSGTKKYLASVREKKYQKNPLTFLNGENWNDDYEVKAEQNYHFDEADKDVPSYDEYARIMAERFK